MPGVEARAVGAERPQRDAVFAFTLSGVLHRTEHDQIMATVPVEIGDGRRRVGEVGLERGVFVLGVPLSCLLQIVEETDAVNLVHIFEHRVGVEGDTVASMQTDVSVVLGGKDVDRAVAV